MKLNKNEKKLLRELIKNPKINNIELSKKLKITSQGIGKIKRSLENKKIIDGYEVKLNYKKIGIRCFALTLVKVMPKAFRKYKKDIDDIFSHPNILMSVSVPQTSITHLVLFGFRDVSEYSTFFRELQLKLPGIIEIKESHVFSNESIIKDSAKELFLDIIGELGDKIQSHPQPPEVEKE